MAAAFCGCGPVLPMDDGMGFLIGACAFSGGHGIFSRAFIYRKNADVNRKYVSTEEQTCLTYNLLYGRIHRTKYIVGEEIEIAYLWKDDFG